MFLFNGNPLQIDTPFEINGTCYPANWLRLTSIEEKNAVGITEVPDEVASYDDRFYWGVGNPKQLEDEIIIPEEGQDFQTYEQKGLKSNWSAQIKDTTNKLLAASDWMVIRKVERNVDIPDSTVTYRAAVLAECDRLLGAIQATSDVDALASVLNQQNWPRNDNV